MTLAVIAMTLAVAPFTFAVIVITFAVIVITFVVIVIAAVEIVVVPAPRASYARTKKQHRRRGGGSVTAELLQRFPPRLIGAALRFLRSVRSVRLKTSKPRHLSSSPSLLRARHLQAQRLRDRISTKVSVGERSFRPGQFLFGQRGRPCWV